MDRETFKDCLSRDLRAILDRHGIYSNEGVAFTHWVLENVFLQSDSEARSANFDGPDDGGLDGFIVDEHENLIRLVQCKYSENIDRADRESFIVLPHKLSDPERVATQNPRIYPCSTQYKELFDGNYDLYMAFVFIGESRPEYTDQMKSALQNSLTSELLSRFTVEVIGVDELIVRYLAKSPFEINIPESKILRYKSDTLLWYNGENASGLIATVAGNDLAAFGDSPEMFLANFRFFLDLRNRVNAKMSETVQHPDERQGFWMYNNGITIVCDRFDEPNQQEKSIKLYRPQIVNGCQTASILNRPVVNRFSQDIDVLVRIIATDDDEIKRKIATYTNSQTKVSDRTLRSNDPIQKSLQQQFVHWDPPYFYDCKDGEWNALPRDQKFRFQESPRRYRCLNNKDCAKAYTAFHGKPIEAKSSPRLFWDLGPRGLYVEVFPKSRRAEELLLPYLLMESFNTQIENALGALPVEPTGEEALRKEYLRHCDTTMLALAGHIIKRYLQDDLSSQHLTDLISRLDSFAEPLFARCEAPVKYEFGRSFSEATERDELFNARNYFFRRTTFTTMARKLGSDMELVGENEFYLRCGFG